MTMIDSKSPIVFSFPACRGMVTILKDAERILAHESVHHFGISDESFPTDVAEAILVGNPDCQIEIPEDVFDEASCPGEKLSTSEMLEWFDPAQTKSKDVVIMKAYQKSRECHTLTGCTQWEVRQDSDIHCVRYDSGFPFTKGDVVRADSFKSINVNFHASSSSVRPWLVSSPDGTIGTFVDSNGAAGYFTGRTSNGAFNFPAVHGKITRECARFSSTDKSRVNGSGNFSEWHTVYFGKTMNPQ